MQVGMVCRGVVHSTIDKTFVLCTYNMCQEEGRVRETHIVDVVQVHLRVKNTTPVSLRSLAALHMHQGWLHEADEHHLQAKQAQSMCTSTHPHGAGLEAAGQRVDDVHVLGPDAC